MKSLCFKGFGWDQFQDCWGKSVCSVAQYLSGLRVKMSPDKILEGIICHGDYKWLLHLSLQVSGGTCYKRSGVLVDDPRNQWCIQEFASLDTPLLMQWKLKEAEWWVWFIGCWKLRPLCMCILRKHICAENESKEVKEIEIRFRKFWNRHKYHITVSSFICFCYNVLLLYNIFAFALLSY